jgi:hypothetical protein
MLTPDSRLQIPDEIMNQTTQWDTGRLREPPFRAFGLLSGLALFGIGFGFVEAVVVVDLRAMLSPLIGRTDPLSADEVLPLIAFEGIGRADPVASRLMRLEVLREAATLILLAGAGMAAGRTFAQRFASFLIAFSVWDLCYYLFLKVLIGWPTSVWTWDVLFLVPLPWAAPVLAPAIVAASMVTAGSAVIVSEATGRPFPISRCEWVAIVTGGLLLIAAFCWDWRNIAAGGMPNPFPWPLFFLGEAIGFGSFLHASWGHRTVWAARAESMVTSSDPIIAS